MEKKGSVIERLIRIEILLDNHLKHHENLNRFILAPIGVGVILTLIKLYFFK